MSEEYMEWELSHEIETAEDAIAYLQIAFEETPLDTKHIQHLMGEIGRGLGMTALARELGVSRPALYRSLSEEGNPSFKTIVNFIELLGGSLAVVPTVAQEEVEDKELVSA